MKQHPSSRELARLLEVIRMRVRKAHKAYQQQLETWREYRRKVEEQRAEVAELDQDLQRVVAYLERADVIRDPEKLQFAVSRRRWTIYDREKAQYYLDMAEQDLRQAAVELDRLKKVWLKTLALEQRLEDERLRARIREQQASDLRDEIEVDDTHSAGGASPAIGEHSGMII